MMFRFPVPTPEGALHFEVARGNSLIFVGANGAGKTRLAVHLEKTLKLQAHRISAHRMLALNPKVHRIPEEQAREGLRMGQPGVGDGGAYPEMARSTYRWRGYDATAIQNDYDFLLQLLFAQQINITFNTHRNLRKGSKTNPEPTKLEQLEEICERLLPHRRLNIIADDLTVSVKGSEAQYPASEMSDGERSVFYLIGQTLVAEQDSLIIFDEPELHIHRSIMCRLWDEIEAARPDCAIVIITHDLEFAAARKGQKYVIHDYAPDCGWSIEEVPENTGFSEELTTLILGSRRPVLFVEGKDESLDQAIYRACYPEWTIIPRGSCEEVIHAVKTFRANSARTRVTCAGIVDADSRTPEDEQYLRSESIEILPVAEIENLFLLPEVITEILADDGHDGDELKDKLRSLHDELIEHASNEKNQEFVVLNYCRRSIDNTLKGFDLRPAKSVAELVGLYREKTSTLDVEQIAAVSRNNMQRAIRERDIPLLLKWYDNKGVLSIASKARDTTVAYFKQWLVRTLRNNKAPKVAAAIKNVLPVVTAR